MNTYSYSAMIYFVTATESGSELESMQTGLKVDN